MSHMDRFMAVYAEIQEFVLSLAATKYAMDEGRRRYMKEMMDVTCLGGKFNRGLCVVEVAEAIATEQGGIDAERLERILHDACVCGWMIEMLQAHFLVEDDIMDRSTVRRGRPCWYLHPGVTEQVAINDGLILLASATQIAFHFLEDRPFLVDVLRFFHEVNLTTTVGQFYDLTSMLDPTRLDSHAPRATTTDYVEFTMVHYQRIVKNKTAYYTYWLPLAMGLLVSGIYAAVDTAAVERVALLMGEYFQVQDDIMDCFTPPERLGKVGTDIQDAKCSWLAVMFLAVASPEQVRVFKKSYGRADATDVAVVKRLFEEAGLLERFNQYEASVQAEVQTLLAELAGTSAALAKSVQLQWQKIYKRGK